MMYFRDGTTDVTRTMHFGTPTDFEKVSYYCEIIINRGVLIFVDFVLHLNYEN